MQNTIVILTQHEQILRPWNENLQQLGFETQWIRTEEELDSLVQSQDSIKAPIKGVIIHAQSDLLTEDDLLWTISFCKTQNWLTSVSLPNSDSFANIYNLLFCACEGRIFRSENSIPNACQILKRQIDDSFKKTIEYATLSPDEKALLLIFANGKMVTHKRPLSNEDDLSEIEHIQIKQEGKSISFELTSKTKFDFTPQAQNNLESPEPSPSDSSPLDNTHELIFDSQLIGARLRQFRIDRGLTQAELSERTGIYRPNIARVEAGRHTPALETLVKMSRALGISPFYVLSTESPSSDTSTQKEDTKEEPQNA